jgi:hypothetical protein
MRREQQLAGPQPGFERSVARGACRRLRARTVRGPGVDTDDLTGNAEPAGERPAVAGPACRVGVQAMVDVDGAQRQGFRHGDRGQGREQHRGIEAAAERHEMPGRHDTRFRQHTLERLAQPLRREAHGCHTA